ncbi:16S rRNA (adenine(1518)-N(6)/adenine(1519)-N(6))-dimethyltransferase RsmA [Alkalispirochaeta alkalica]|uniref:16S rRNA (adenine(1518)-N(6)/adenine(1519)-N(6))- dimethyltransferase RsmA n=1 Tax=Alkalispirochaeta alkalica TaxID=46356 RepID=UPI0003602661|nr:16S rRNA (adenine(1518)-N(6)/adenine(1519)-N(6))-dimethyltransferase RsmA [Alkalispirochaeta alkalica]
MNHNSISEIRDLLDRHEIGLKKRFGQNFLIDSATRHRIGSLIAQVLPRPLPGSGEIWEIGPGLGALTDELRALELPLRLFEIDRGVIRVLRERYGEDLPIEGGDFLDTFRGLPAPGAIVGNLPYHSAGAMVPRIVESGLAVPVMVFLLQSEMVDRLVSPPGCKTYSALSVLVQSHYQVERAFLVPAGVFYPRPQVGSAVAVLRELPHRPSREVTEQISLLTREAFGQRRKTLRNTWKAWLPALEECGIDPGLRPEELQPETFRLLAEHLRGVPGAGQPRAVRDGR